MYSYKRRDDGFGICGSKNVYSSNVRLGNWREDEYGEQLACKPRHGTIPSDTVYSSSYGPIESRPEPPPFPAKMPKPFELFIKNKEGTPYHVIFNDGRKPLSSEERFKSVNRLTFSGDQVMQSYAIPDGALRAIKEKQFQDDVDLSVKMVTETKAASAYADEIISKRPNPIEKHSEPLPDWRSCLNPCYGHKNNYCINSPEEISRSFTGQWKNKSYDHLADYHKNGSVSSWANVSCPVEMLRYSCYINEFLDPKVRELASMKENRYFEFDDCKMKEFDAFTLLDALRNRKLVYHGDSLSVLFFSTMVCSLHKYIRNVQYNIRWFDDAKRLYKFCRVKPDTPGFVGTGGKQCLLKGGVVYYPDYNVTIILFASNVEHLPGPFLSSIFNYFNMTKYDVLLLNAGMHFNYHDQMASFFTDTANEYRTLDKDDMPAFIWRETTPQHYSPGATTYLNGYFSNAFVGPTRCTPHDHPIQAYYTDYRNRLADYYLLPLHIPILRLNYALATEYQYHMQFIDVGSFDCTHFCLSSGIMQYVREIEYNTILSGILKPYPSWT